MAENELLNSTAVDTANEYDASEIQVLEGPEAVAVGLIDEVGGLKEALAKLHQMIDENGTENG